MCLSWWHFLGEAATFLLTLKIHFTCRNTQISYSVLEGSSKRPGEMDLNIVWGKGEQKYEEWCWSWCLFPNSEVKNDIVWTILSSTEAIGIENISWNFFQVACPTYWLLSFSTISNLQCCVFPCFFLHSVWTTVVCFCYFNLVFSSSSPIYGQNQVGRETHVYFAVCGQI